MLKQDVCRPDAFLSRPANRIKALKVYSEAMLDNESYLLYYRLLAYVSNSGCYTMHYVKSVMMHVSI